MSEISPQTFLGSFNSSFLLNHQAAVLSVVLVATSLFSLKKLTNNVNEGERGSSRGILSGQLECCPSYLLTSFHLGIQYIHREQLMFYYLLFHISISIYFLLFTISNFLVYSSCAGLNIKLWSARYTRIALRCSNLFLLQMAPQFNFKKNCWFWIQKKMGFGKYRSAKTKHKI